MYVVDQRLGNYTKMDPEGIFTVSESNRYWTGGLPEKDQINWMCATFGTASGVAIDIGAHCGTWTLSLAKSFKQVYAFEPNPAVHNVLRGNLALRQIANVRVSHKALSDRAGDSRYFVRSPDGGGNGIEPLNPKIDASGPSFLIKTTTLDAYCNSNDFCSSNDWLPGDERITLVKIDVEGHELSVLKGARRTIDRHKPAIVLESWIEQRENDGIPAVALRQELFAYVEKELGYAIRPVSGHWEMFLCTPLPQSRSTEAPGVAEPVVDAEGLEGDV